MIEQKIVLIPESILDQKNAKEFLIRLVQKKQDFIVLSQSSSFEQWQKNYPFLKRHQFYSSLQAAMFYVKEKKAQAKVNYFGPKRYAKELKEADFLLDYAQAEYLFVGRKSYIEDQEIAFVLSNIESGATILALDSRRVQSKDGQVVPGGGGFAWWFAYMSQKKLYSFGLDSKLLMKSMMKEYRLSSRNLIRLCVDLDPEVELCKSLNIASIFYSYGKELDYFHLKSEQQADYIVDSLDGILK